ncbi:calcium:cation antiporter [Mesorhizobium sp. A623]
MSIPLNPSPAESVRDILPPATLLRLALSWAVVIAFLVGGKTWLADPISALVAIISFIVLFATILAAAFGVGREADHLAHKLGEPYGTLILTLSIVAIEVILIAAVMMGPGESAMIARDSIFAVMMIILNLVTGICLVLGGLRYGEQEYNSQGAVAYLSMIVLLTGVALGLPNLVSRSDGTFLPEQAIPIAVVTLILYGTFLSLQMRGYRRFFVQPAPGSLSSPSRPADNMSSHTSVPVTKLDPRAILLRSVVLVALILPIVLLAHDLAILIDLGIEHAGVPVAVGGVLIAIIVFTPESITAVKAAMTNEMQRAVNLCLGAFVSTVGLTVPVVLTIGLLIDSPVVLGLTPIDSGLLAITIGLSVLTFLGVRTSAVQGMMHLALFVIYAVFLFAP